MLFQFRVLGELVVSGAIDDLGDPLPRVTEEEFQFIASPHRNQCPIV